MGNKKTKHGIPVIGGTVMEMEKFVYRMIVVLSDHLDPKDKEVVIYEYADKEKAKKMKEKILLEGINLTRKDEGIEIDMYYPARQIRKIIIRKEPIQIKKSESSIVH